MFILTFNLIMLINVLISFNELNFMRPSYFNNILLDLKGFSSGQYILKIIGYINIVLMIGTLFQLLLIKANSQNIMRQIFDRFKEMIEQNQKKRTLIIYSKFLKQKKF
ncbi:hypothetical protein pb186bvf_001862 [Paramecium bursaria]